MTHAFPAATGSDSPSPDSSNGRLETALDVDVCILGAGPEGLWTALELASHRRSVVVLEASAGMEAGMEGTAGLGVIEAAYPASPRKVMERVGLAQARALYALASEGRARVRLALMSGQDPALQPASGTLTLWPDGGHERMMQRCDRLNALGLRVTPVAADDVSLSAPSPAYAHALRDSQSFALDPVIFLGSLKATVERAGGRIFHRTPVRSIDSGGIRKIVETPYGRVRAEHVVLTGAALSDGGYRPTRGCCLPAASYSAITEPLRHPVEEVIPFAGALCDQDAFGRRFRRLAGNRLAWEGGVDDWQSGHKASQDMIEDIERLFPSLAPVFLSSCRINPVPVALHHMPVIGGIESGVWAAGGCGRHAMALGAMAARLLAQAILYRDEEWTRFLPFGAVWAGGTVGALLARQYLALRRGWAASSAVRARNTKTSRA